MDEAQKTWSAFNASVNSFIFFSTLCPTLAFIHISIFIFCDKGKINKLIGFPQKKKKNIKLYDTTFRTQNCIATSHERNEDTLTRIK